MVGIFGGSGRCSRCCPREEKFYFSHEVVAALNRDKEAPWADLKDQLTQKSLAAHLRPFGIKSKNRQEGAGNQGKAYSYGDFEKVFASYLGFDFEARQAPDPAPRTEETDKSPQKEVLIRLQPADQLPEPPNCGRMDLADPSTPPRGGPMEQNHPSTVSPLPEPIREVRTDKMPFSGGHICISRPRIPPDTAQAGFKDSP